MKKISIAFLILFVLVSGHLFSTSLTNLSLSIGTNSSQFKPEIGFVSSYQYIFETEGYSVNFGSGSRVDMTLALPAESLNFNVLLGFSSEFQLKHDWNLNLMVGPSIGVLSSFSNSAEDGVFLGGGVDLYATKFFRPEKDVGLSFGIFGAVGALLDSSMKEASFSYLSSAYIGMTIRSLDRIDKDVYRDPYYHGHYYIVL